METTKPGQNPGPAATPIHISTSDQAAHLRRLVIRSRALGDHDRAEVYAILLAFAEAGVHVPQHVIEHAPALIAWEARP